jgi:hypothetical protein
MLDYTTTKKKNEWLWSLKDYMYLKRLTLDFDAVGSLIVWSPPTCLVKLNMDGRSLLGGW